jgi:hypothetical protein
MHLRVKILQPFFQATASINEALSCTVSKDKRGKHQNVTNACHNMLLKNSVHRSWWTRGPRLWSAAVRCWDCGFESHRGYGCLSVVSVVCCQEEFFGTGRLLFQRSRTEYGECVISKPHQWGGLGYCDTGKNKQHSLLSIMISACECLPPQSPAVTLCATMFSIHKSHVLPTQCICVFCVDLRTNSDYFPIQH